MQNIFKGKVVEGDGVAGRDLGTPTANLDLPKDLDLDVGVYAAYTTHDGQVYESTVCYGVGLPLKFEVHLFNFHQDIFGDEIEVEIIEKVSELVPWQSKERMRQKILHDIETAKEIFKRHKKEA